MLQKLTGALLLAAAEAAKCPDLHQFRTSTVLDGFNPTRLEGKWYEVAYEDIAQVGASCQTAENTMTSTGMEQKFKAKYLDKILPFSQTYEYQANDPESPVEVGMYTKYLKGAKALLTLPTVIVDVQSGASSFDHLDRDHNNEGAGGIAGEYEFLIEFTCKNESPLVEVTELRFSARDDTITDEQFATMKQTALGAGIDADLINSVTRVDHSHCRNDDDPMPFTVLQLAFIISLPVALLLILLLTRPPTPTPRRPYLLFVCLSNLVVTGVGWEVVWSCGIGGLSYSERHDAGGVNDPLENAVNAVATTSVDCWLQVLIFVVSSWLIRGRSAALDPPQQLSTIFLLTLTTLGVLQNCVVTLLLPNTLIGVGRAPLAPFQEDFLTFAIVNGRALSVGNNCMWVFAPCIVYAAVLKLWGEPATKPAVSIGEREHLI